MKNNETFRLILIAVVVLIFFGGFGMFGFGGMMSMMYGYGFYGLASIFQFAYRILVFVALILLVVLLWQKIQEKN